MSIGYGMCGISNYQHSALSDDSFTLALVGAILFWGGLLALVIGLFALLIDYLNTKGPRP